MAGETTYSDDLDAIINAGGTTAHALVPVARYGGRMRMITGNFEVAATEIEDTDIIVIARVPAHAVIHSLMFTNDALDAASGLGANVGVYETDGTAVNDECYAADDDFLQADAAPPGEDLKWFVQTDPTDMGQAVWEDAGEASDPGGVMRDIAITIETAATTAQAGTIGYKIEYTVD